MRRQLTYSLFAAMLAVTATGGLTACAKKTPSASSSADTTLGPDESPSADPSADPSATDGTVVPSSSPSAAASPSSGGGSSGGTPHSTKASKAGFVWSYNSAGSYAASSAYQFNSAGGAINITYNGVGSYTVTFNGLGGSGGVAHAQAYGNNSNFCIVSSWINSGGNEKLNIRCYNAGGAPVDSTFVASYAVGSQGSARFSYLWANDPTATSTYKPSESYRYDAVSSADITVKRTATGRYEVYLPAAGPELSDPWNFQITAYGSASQCKLASFSASSRKAQVACRTAGGAAADTRFSLSFNSEGSFLGRGDRRFGEYSSGSDGVSNPSTGVYSVRASELGQPKGQVVALARGTSSTYCHVRNWQVAGADLDMTVVCFNPGGAPASSSFTLGVTW